MRKLLMALAMCLQMMGATAQTLTVGSAAPSLAGVTWAQGAPVTAYARGQIYVVEFWSTWCGPCKNTIPHLNSFAKKHLGKVTVIGADIWEEAGQDGASLCKNARQFASEMGGRMQYPILVDDPGGSVAKSWMDAAGKQAIPVAFVVDGSGMIAWIGHPMQGLEQVVDELLAGTFDRKKAPQETVDPEFQRKMADAKPFLDLIEQGEWKECLDLIDAAIKKNAGKEKDLGILRYSALVHLDATGATDYANRLLTTVFKDAPQYLMNLAWTMVDDESWSQGDPKLAVRIAEQAIARLDSTDRENYVLNLTTLATANFKAGNRKEAVQIQQRAIAIAKSIPGFSEDDLNELKTHLRTFQGSGP